MMSIWNLIYLCICKNMMFVLLNQFFLDSLSIHHSCNSCTQKQIFNAQFWIADTDCECDFTQNIWINNYGRNMYFFHFQVREVVLCVFLKWLCCTAILTAKNSFVICNNEVYDWKLLVASCIFLGIEIEFKVLI